MLHRKMKFTYVGADSHKDSHTLVFMNCFHEKVGEMTVSSSPGAFDDFFKEAQKYKVPSTVFAFGFEDVSAYGRSIIKFLKGKNQIVKHVNAALVATERKGMNILHKTDSIDAECAARCLISRFDTLPSVDPNDKYWIMANLIARRNLMVKMNVSLKNHLHSLLPDHYPGYSKFFSRIDGSGALAFYENYPSPSVLLRSSEEEVASMLCEVSQGKLNKNRAHEIFQAVRKNKVPVSPYQETRDFTIQSTIRQIRSNMSEINSIDNQLAGFLSHFDYPLTSLKGIDVITAAELIAEIGDIERFKSPAALAKYAGVAPVTYSSGMTAVQYANLRGNRRLNMVFFRLALRLTTVTGYKDDKKFAVNLFLHEYYVRKQSEGKTKRQSLKCVERRLVNIVYSIMKHKKPYINPPIFYTDKESGADNIVADDDGVIKISP